MHSLKKDMIVSYAMLTELDMFKSNKLLLVTAAGIITGYLTNSSKHDDDTTLSALALTTVNKQINTRYKEQLSMPLEQLLDGNDGFISLEDVTLLSGDKQSVMPFLNVFFDQIIAVTISGDSK